MQDVKVLKVLQVLPDEGGRTKSLFELCLNFRITISPLENWPPGLIVFEKKRANFYTLAATLMKTNKTPNVRTKVLKNITCQQICIKKANLQNFSNFSKEIFLEIFLESWNLSVVDSENGHISVGLFTMSRIPSKSKGRCLQHEFESFSISHGHRTRKLLAFSCSATHKRNYCNPATLKPTGHRV